MTGSTGAVVHVPPQFIAPLVPSTDAIAMALVATQAAAEHAAAPPPPPAAAPVSPRGGLDVYV